MTRIIPPDEAREVAENWSPFGPTVRDLAHTAAVQGDRVAAVLALHRRVNGWCDHCYGDGDSVEWPCETAELCGAEALPEDLAARAERAREREEARAVAKRRNQQSVWRSLCRRYGWEWEAQVRLEARTGLLTPEFLDQVGDWPLR